MLDRRSLLKGIAAWPLLASARAARPNIVLILADDLGYADLGCYGAAGTRTPNIDSIARRGVRFTQFYSNAPECTPTRSALLTGRYQQRFRGLECAIGIGNVGRYDEAISMQQRGELGLPASEPTIARLLKNAGYDTACIGKWHLGYLDKFHPNRHGFDEFFGILGGGVNYFTHEEESSLHAFYHNREPIRREGYLTDLIAAESVRWLSRRSGKPFFLYAPFTAPHLPAQGPDDQGKPADKAGRNRETYIKMVERLDDGVGAILNHLERSGLAENTLVVFTSDNGAIPLGRNMPFRGFKSSLWEGGIRVPCAMRWPGVLPESKVTGQPAISMDLLPTILSATQTRSPIKLDGMDLLPVLRGGAQPFARTLFWRYKRGESRRKAVRDGDMKYVLDDGREELHDLSTDPQEQRDLLAQTPALAATLRRKLAAWERDVSGGAGS